MVRLSLIFSGLLKNEEARLDDTYLKYELMGTTKYHRRYTKLQLEGLCIF